VISILPTLLLLMLAATMIMIAHLFPRADSGQSCTLQNRETFHGVASQKTKTAV